MSLLRFVTTVATLCVAARGSRSYHVRAGLRARYSDCKIGKGNAIKGDSEACKAACDAASSSGCASFNFNSQTLQCWLMRGDGVGRCSTEEVPAEKIHTIFWWVVSSAAPTATAPSAPTTQRPTPAGALSRYQLRQDMRPISSRCLLGGRGDELRKTASAEVCALHCDVETGCASFTRDAATSKCLFFVETGFGSCIVELNPRPNVESWFEAPTPLKPMDSSYCAMERRRKACVDKRQCSYSGKRCVVRVPTLQPTSKPTSLAHKCLSAGRSVKKCRMKGPDCAWNPRARRCLVRTASPTYAPSAPTTAAPTWSPTAPTNIPTQQPSTAQQFQCASFGRRSKKRCKKLRGAGCEWDRARRTCAVRTPSPTMMPTVPGRGMCADCKHWFTRESFFALAVERGIEWLHFAGDSSTRGTVVALLNLLDPLDQSEPYSNARWFNASAQDIIHSVPDSMADDWDGVAGNMLALDFWFSKSPPYAVVHKRGTSGPMGLDANMPARYRDYIKRVVPSVDLVTLAGGSRTDFVRVSFLNTFYPSELTSFGVPSLGDWKATRAPDVIFANTGATHWAKSAAATPGGEQVTVHKLLRTVRDATEPMRTKLVWMTIQDRDYSAYDVAMASAGPAGLPKGRFAVGDRTLVARHNPKMLLNNNHYTMLINHLDVQAVLNAGFDPEPNYGSVNFSPSCTEKHANLKKLRKAYAKRSAMLPPYPNQDWRNMWKLVCTVTYEEDS